MKLLDKMCKNEMDLASIVEDGYWSLWHYSMNLYDDLTISILEEQNMYSL